MKYYTINFSDFYNGASTSLETSSTSNIVYEFDNKVNRLLLSDKFFFEKLHNSLNLNTQLEFVPAEIFDKELLSAKIINQIDCVDIENTIVIPSKSKKSINNAVLQLIVDASKISEKELDIFVCKNPKYIINGSESGAIVVSERLLNILQELNVKDFSYLPAFKEGIHASYQKFMIRHKSSKSPTTLPLINELHFHPYFSYLSLLSIGKNSFDFNSVNYLEGASSLYVAEDASGAVIQLTSDIPYFLSEINYNEPLNLSPLYKSISTFKLKGLKGLIKYSSEDTSFNLKVSNKKEVEVLIIEQFPNCLFTGIEVKLNKNFVNYNETRLYSQDDFYKESIKSNADLALISLKKEGTPFLLGPLHSNEKGELYLTLEEGELINNHWSAITTCGTLVLSKKLFASLINKYPTLLGEEVNVLKINRQIPSESVLIETAICIKPYSSKCISLDNSTFKEIGFTKNNNPINVYDKVMIDFNTDILKKYHIIRSLELSDIFFMHCDFANEIINYKNYSNFSTIIITGN